MNVVGITGATGFVGSALARAFHARGWRVVELGRRPSRHDAAFAPLDLEASTAPELPPELSVLVHCAYRAGSRSMEDEERVNVRRSSELLDASTRLGCRFVFISSMAAFDNARSIYGRGKFATEQQVLHAGGTVIRPGLITGPGSRGLVPAIARFMRVSPLVPMPDFGARNLHLCDVSRFAERVVDVCESAPGTKPIVIARAEPIALADLLRSIARRDGRRIWLVPIPARWVYSALRIVEKLGLRLPFRSDSIVSLLYANPQPLTGVRLLDPGEA